MRTLRAAAGALATALALASCTLTHDGDAASPQRADSTPQASTPSTDGSTSSATGSSGGATGGGPPPPAPRVGECYRLGFSAATAPTSNRPPVPCSQPHTAQTYYVGRLDTVVDGHLLAVDSKLAQRQIEQTCPRKLDAYVGGSAETRALSRIKAVWFSPTIEQSDEGASWFRCDAVAVAKTSTLAPLPHGLRGILGRPDALRRLGICGTAAPGTRGFERVICSRPHSWKAMSTITIGGGKDYPGVAQVRNAGEGTCRDRVQAAIGSPDRFSYGWEWPTAAQWRSGQRFGYCWAPD